MYILGYFLEQFNSRGLKAYKNHAYVCAHKYTHIYTYISITSIYQHIQTLTQTQMYSYVYLTVHTHISNAT